MPKLTDLPTKAPKDLDRKSIGKEMRFFQNKLFDLQRLLYANSRHSLLILFQGLDAAGKDGTIRHVFSCINPMGCNVTSFKKPSEEELKHDFLWRIYPHVPAKGMIQIFNRSHYEDILVPTVHGTHNNAVIQHRYDYINLFEQHLQLNGTILLKFFLHVSQDKQKQKLALRLKDPKRKWKFDEADITEQKNREAYLKVYQEIFSRCSPEIPWHIIPADHKWYRNYLIAKTVVHRLEALDMRYPN
jgi:PPK2 family polyphosphate:nucleotide phosphotransferase